MSHVAVDVDVPDEDDAHRLSRTLVEERIAAGTRTSSGTSHYRWEGEVHERANWTVTAFTTAEHLDRLYDLLDGWHEDDLPGVTRTEIQASDEFLEWIEANTG